MKKIETNKSDIEVRTNEMPQDIFQVYYTFTLLHILATIDSWLLYYLIGNFGIEQLEHMYSCGNMLRQSLDINMEYEFAKERYKKNIITYHELRYKTCAYVLSKNILKEKGLNLDETNYEIIKNTLIQYVQVVSSKWEKINQNDIEAMIRAVNSIDDSQLIADIFYKNLLKNNLITKSEFKKLLK